MTPATKDDPTILDQTFEFCTTTHSYSIKWTSLGDPKTPPLVFIHGTPWSSRVWVRLAIALSEQFHVYLFDNPGFGESPVEKELPGAEYGSDNITKWDSDLARQTEAFAALFKSWEIDFGGQKAHIIAHDIGALQSLRAHILHGCQYASLLLFDAVALGPLRNPLFELISENPEKFIRKKDASFDPLVESYIRQAVYHLLDEDEMDELKSPWLKEGGKEGFIRQMCQAAYRSTKAIEERYPEVGQNMPVKVIWGRMDDWVPCDRAWKLKKALGAEEIVIIEEAGHLIMYDQPAQVETEIVRWLAAVALQQES